MKPTRLLVALGLTELLAVGVLGWFEPAHRFPFPGLVLFAVAFAVYALAAWWLTRPTGSSIRAIWVLGVAMRLALVPLAPELSDDVYRYLWDGHVQLSGGNPYAFAPDAPELTELRTPYHTRINNPSVPTIYPPLAQLAFLVVALLGSSMLAAKLLWLTCDLATAAVLAMIARRTGRNEPLVLLLYLWAPLLVVEVAWSAHLEPLGLLPLALAILWTGSKPLRAGAALALSALTKFAPAAALPALVRRDGWQPAVAFGVCALVLYAPFAGAGTALFTGLRTYGEHWWFMKGPFALLELVARDPLQARQLAAAVVLGAVAWTVVRRFDLERALLWVIGTGMIVTPTLHPWYVLWMLPVAALRQSRAWLLLGGLAPIGYYGLSAYQESGVWPQPALARAALWLPFLALLALDAVRARGETDASEGP